MKSKTIRVYRWLAELVIPLTCVVGLLLVLFSLVTTLDGLFHDIGLAHKNGERWVLGARGWEMLRTRFGLGAFGSFFMIGWAVGFVGLLISYERYAGSNYRRQLRCVENERQEAQQWAERRVRENLKYEFQRAEEAKSRAEAAINASYERMATMERELRSAQLRAEIAEERGSSATAKTRKTNNSVSAAERRNRRSCDDVGVNPKPSR